MYNFWHVFHKIGRIFYASIFSSPGGVPRAELGAEQSLVPEVGGEDEDLGGGGGQPRHGCRQQRVQPPRDEAGEGVPALQHTAGQAHTGRSL